MLPARSASVLTTLAALTTFGVATAASGHAVGACDPSINGTFTATSDGRWAKTREVYHDEGVVVATWTIASECADVMHCSGTVVSDQGWTSELRCQSGLWYVTHHIDQWQPCPDGTTTPGEQAFRFYRFGDDPETYRGFDRTIGPSGGCGVNLWLTVEMPLMITRTA